MTPRYLHEADLLQLIRPHLLQQLLEDEPARLLQAEGKAIELASGYLRPRFDVSRIFFEGAERNVQLVSVLADITLYELHARISGTDIPTHRQARYDDAIQWLKDVANGKVEPSLPAKPQGPGDDYANHVPHGSNPKQRLQY